MAFISSLGFLAFFCSLIYLIYHLIRKIKHRERKLPKKKFYSFLIGGLLISIIGDSFADKSIQGQLNESIAANTTLTVENNEFRTTNKKLEDENKILKEENDKFSKEVEDLTLKLADLDKFEKELKDQQAAHQEKVEEFEKEVNELKTVNSTLKTEVDTMKSQFSSKNKNSTASSSGSSSSNAANTTTSAQVASGGSEWFQNCTELRKKYPRGVSSDHPAYQSKMDRDNDGWACER